MHTEKTMWRHPPTSPGESPQKKPSLGYLAIRLLASRIEMTKLRHKRSNNLLKLITTEAGWWMQQSVFLSGAKVLALKEGTCLLVKKLLMFLFVPSLMNVLRFHTFLKEAAGWGRESTGSQYSEMELWSSLDFSDPICEMWELHWPIFMVPSCAKSLWFCDSPGLGKSYQRLIQHLIS